MSGSDQIKPLPQVDPQARRAELLAARKAAALAASEGLFERLQGSAAAEDMRAELGVQHDRLTELDRRLGQLPQDMATYRDTCRLLAETLTGLADAADEAGLAEIKAALRALGAGDFTLADAVLAVAVAKGAGDAVEAARLALAQGLIAEDDLRWQDAARHYTLAARLDPDLMALRKARALACRTGDLTAAFRLGKGLIVLAETAGSPADRAAALRDHAETLEAQDRWVEAEGVLRKALQADRGAKSGPPDPGQAAALARLSRVLEAQDRLPEAEVVLRKALEVSRHSIGEAHPGYAAKLAQLAGILTAQEREVEAEPLLQKALDIARRLGAAPLPVIVDCLSGLAGLAEAQGRLAEAEILHRQALAVGSAGVGATHPDHAARLFALADVVRAQRRLPEAEALFRQALQIDGATIGEGHRDYGIGLNNLASVVEAQGRVAEAEHLYAAALNIFRQTLGDLDPATLKVARNFRALLAVHLPQSPHRASVEALWQAGQQDMQGLPDRL